MPGFGFGGPQIHPKPPGIDPEPGGDDGEGGNANASPGADTSLNCVDIDINSQVTSLSTAITEGITQVKDNLGNKRCIKFLLPENQHALDASINLKSDDFSGLNPEVEKIKIVFQGREGTRLTRSSAMGNQYAFTVEEQQQPLSQSHPIEAATMTEGDPTTGAQK